tara:strand:- start:1231 stop:1464 length:234 start_codon:yes stop_codon:yes gene_type:complete
MENTRLISALHAKATADKEKALMALNIMINNSVAIGDHTADDLMKDAEKSLDLLCSAEDRLTIIETFFLETADDNEE